MHACMHAWMCICMYVCTSIYACMHVCMKYVISITNVCNVARISPVWPWPWPCDHDRDRDRDHMCVYVCMYVCRMYGCIGCDSTHEGMHMHELMLFSHFIQPFIWCSLPSGNSFQSCSCLVRKVSEIRVTRFVDPCVFCITRSRPENTGKACVPVPTRPEPLLSDPPRPEPLLSYPFPTRPDPSTAQVSPSLCRSQSKVLARSFEGSAVCNAHAFVSRIVCGQCVCHCVTRPR